MHGLPMQIIIRDNMSPHNGAALQYGYGDSIYAADLLPVILDAERPEFLRVELEEVVFFETPAPVDADGAGGIHTRALVEGKEILHRDNRHARV